MSPPPVFFWQNMPAHHQTGALDALAKTWGSPVHGVWCSGLDERRKALGWTPRPCSHLVNVTLPSAGWRKEVQSIVSGSPDGIHMFSGIGAYPPVTVALNHLMERPNPRIGLIVESPIMHGWRRWARLLKARHHYLPRRNQIRAVFAMGSLGMRFYKDLGLKDEQLFPFMYQEDVPPCLPVPTPETTRIIYAGQLDQRKGVDVLIAALGRVTSPNWTLGVFGDGSERRRLQNMAFSSGLAGKIAFHGVVKSEQVAARMREHDLCVVPSRFDGWGMATNEALQSCVPVIASDKAGSSDLVHASGAGAVFVSEDVHGLAQLIDERLRKPELINHEKMLASRYADKISPSTVGAYLQEALQHAFLNRRDKPAPPWLAQHAC